MCKSSKTEAISKEADQMAESSGGVHIAELHSQFHTSGACVAAFCLVFLAIIVLLYCYRKKLCIEVVPSPSPHRSLSRFEQFRRSLRYGGKPPPGDDIDINWRNNTNTTNPNV